MLTYSNARYGTPQVVKVIDTYTMTSVQASAANFARITMFRNATITDWNLQIHNGTTCTGTPNFKVTLNHSLAGTGALIAIGTATVGTQANVSCLDAAVVGGTACNLAAGDDVVIATVAGTALPADSIQIGALVEYTERFV